MIRVEKRFNKKLYKGKKNLGWCLLSKLSINLSEEQLPWERGTLCFSEFPTPLMLQSSACPSSCPMSVRGSEFSSSPNSKRCNISSLEMVLCTCCLSTTLAASPSFVTCLDHWYRQNSFQKIQLLWGCNLLCHYLTLVDFFFHSSMCHQSISKHWLFLAIPEELENSSISFCWYLNLRNKKRHQSKANLQAL